MTPADARELCARYGTSIFRAEFSGGCDPKRVPVVKGRELVAAMLENLEEARADLKRAADRMRDAKADGLLDPDAAAGLEKDERAAWKSAVGVVRGDYITARSNVAHWQEYAEWASSLPEPDARLPPEREPEWTEENAESEDW